MEGDKIFMTVSFSETLVCTAGAETVEDGVSFVREQWVGRLRNIFLPMQLMIYFMPVARR